MIFCRPVIFLHGWLREHLLIGCRQLLLWFWLPFVLASCTSAQFPAAQFVDAAQPQWAATLPLDQPLGQTFLVNHAGLQAVEVYLAFQQPYTGTLTLHL